MYVCVSVSMLILLFHSMSLKLDKQNALDLKSVGQHTGPGLGESRDMLKWENLKSHSGGRGGGGVPVSCFSASPSHLRL